MYLLILIHFVWLNNLISASTVVKPQDLTESVQIAKCCDMNEIILDDKCALLTETNETTIWKPDFIDDNFPINKKQQPNFHFKIGLPLCRSTEHQWHVYYNPRSQYQDLLAILPSGNLRHILHDRWSATQNQKPGSHSLVDDDSITVESLHFDYAFGHYCADKAVLSENALVTTYAMICVPAVAWTDSNYLIKHVVDPITRAFAIACYLFVAIVYFVLPQLRDLVGNMITSMTMCLAVNQIAVTGRILTEYGSHVSFLIADSVAYISLLSAFFWLNSLGYFVWNTFRSRNIFLRVSDGQKYCYYSMYVWGSTVTIAGTAIFAHFTLETNKVIVEDEFHHVQETVGWLGMSVLFTSVAFTIIVNICFTLMTVNTIKQNGTYGRIQHKIKYSFRMFTLLFGTLSLGWLSLLISQLKYDNLIYCHIAVNFVQAFAVVYICVFGQKRVLFLLSKTCNCCISEQNTSDEFDWGEEMTAINAGY
ncbi:probable G-protein coupled receptor Mth-like 5 [Microplitis demolitor]|uniref:probable G-protein coupled receptor Mth-like 5 n=1 Tax=Microplitis demolitor TaxID=69319 RepID=UPI0004CCE70F|nr:probable G-protein coupled receptor Mth-like 5 [Microplitis demolitor]XP_008554129.1 probable G-protein coupled receptor Mth-like 5 [Microplitis demolitor]